MIIPDKTDRFNVYLNVIDAAHKIAVTSEITLPTFEYMSSTISLSGMPGEVDSPSPGQIKSAQVEIPFTNISKDNFTLVQDDNIMIILKAALETINTEKLSRSHVNRTILIKGFTKEVNFGKLAKGEYGNPSVKKEIIYYKDAVNGEVITEIDKFNGVTKINGVDLVANIGDLI
ncbi:MAG: phage major tail tube protein [Lachnospiraceae bacterium]